MYQFYIVEIKKNDAGEYEHTVYWAYDQNADTARLKGESKYYEVLSAAAVSEFTEHSAIMFSSDGFPVMHRSYIHNGSTSESVEE